MAGLQYLLLGIEGQSAQLGPRIAAHKAGAALLDRHNALYPGKGSLMGCSGLQGINLRTGSCAACWAKLGMMPGSLANAACDRAACESSEYFGSEICRVSPMSQCLPFSNPSDPTHSHGNPASLVRCCRIGTQLTSLRGWQAIRQVPQGFSLARPSNRSSRNIWRYVLFACSQAVL